MRHYVKCDGCNDYQQEYNFNYYDDKLLCYHCIQDIIDNLEGRGEE